MSWRYRSFAAGRTKPTRVRDRYTCVPAAANLFLAFGGVVDVSHLFAIVLEAPVASENQPDRENCGGHCDEHGLSASRTILPYPTDCFLWKVAGEMPSISLALGSGRGATDLHSNRTGLAAMVHAW